MDRKEISFVFILSIFLLPSIILFLDSDFPCNRRFTFSDVICVYVLKGWVFFLIKEIFFLWKMISSYPYNNFFCHWHIYSTKQIAMTLWIIIPYARSFPDQILYRINLDKLLSTYTQSIPIMVKYIFFCSLLHTKYTYTLYRLYWFFLCSST